MAYLSQNDKQQDPQAQQQQQPGQVTSLGSQVADPGVTTPGSGGNQGQGSESSVITPGSVGAGSAQGGSYSPAWTNIQSYLQANPNQTNVVEGFQDRADKVVQDESQRSQSYYDEVKKPFEQIQQSYNTLQSAADPGNELKTWLTEQVRQGPDYSNQFLDSTNQILNTDFNSMSVNPYQMGEQYNQLRGALDDRDQFTSMVNETNAEKAGRKLTSGQQALQNQLDLSSGQFGRAREEALSRLAGVEQSANDMNATVEQDAQAIQDLGGYQQQLKNDLLASGDEYLTEFASNQWDPMQQREENWDRNWESSALNPLRDNLKRDLSSVASGLNYSNIGHLLGSGSYGNWNDAYNTIMGAQNTEDPDAIANAIQTFYDNPYGDAGMGGRNDPGRVFRNTMDTYNNWLNSNRDTIFA